MKGVITMKSMFSKKLISGVMVLSLACTGLPAQADEVQNEFIISESRNRNSIERYAANIENKYKMIYPEQSQLIDKIIQRATNSPEFIYAYNKEDIKAFEMVERSLNNALSPSISTYASTDELYYTSYLIPEIKQKNNSFCGPASTVMALIGSGASGYYYITNTSVTNQWQDNVAGEMPQTGGYGAYVYEVTNIMKKYSSSRYTNQGFWDNTLASYNTALDYIELSLIKDAAPILMVDSTEWFGYYGGKSYRHYLVVETVDILAESITVVDPNNISNKFFGKHSISFEEFKKMCLNADEFYVIYKE